MTRGEKRERDWPGFPSQGMISYGTGILLGRREREREEKVYFFIFSREFTVKNGPQLRDFSRLKTRIFLQIREKGICFEKTGREGNWYGGNGNGNGPGMKNWSFSCSNDAQSYDPI